MRRLVAALVVAAAFGGSAARADEAAGGRLCAEFGAGLDHGLASAPDSLQLNNYLFEAARKGCVSELQRLLKAGATRLSRNRDGETALAVAARAGREPVVSALLAGAASQERRQIDMPDAHGSTPLMLAIHFGRSATARALIDAGADVGAINAIGETALAEAAYAADADIGALLLKKGADPRALDRYGKSPICYAAARGATTLVAALLDAGVDVNARYGGDLTALMWAAGFSDLTPAAAAVATARLLISRGAKLDLVDDRGRSALMIAAGLNRFETARTLLEAGADRGLRDKSGKTAADLAATPEMQALVKM
jgi:ankyrin repeat protein